jgi:hypothetical protein
LIKGVTVWAWISHKLVKSTRRVAYSFLITIMLQIVLMR